MHLTRVCLQVMERNEKNWMNEIATPANKVFRISGGGILLYY